jgi:tetratricopeptide (TPR) repeat protein
LRRTTWLGDFRAVASEISAETRAALALDDRDPWAHFVQGNLFFRTGRSGDATRALRRALELNPNFALAHAFLGSSLSMQGAHQDAVDSAEHALRLSPSDRSVVTYASSAMANVHFAAGRYPESAAWARSAIEKSPEWLPGHTFLTAALAMEGDLNAVSEARGTLFRLRPEFSLTWMSENQPQVNERLREALRKAGVPEA